MLILILLLSSIELFAPVAVVVNVGAEELLGNVELSHRGLLAFDEDVGKTIADCCCCCFVFTTSEVRTFSVESCTPDFLGVCVVFYNLITWIV
eukprot:UN03243